MLPRRDRALSSFSNLQAPLLSSSSHQWCLFASSVFPLVSYLSIRICCSVCCSLSSLSNAIFYESMYLVLLLTVYVHNSPFICRFSSDLQLLLVMHPSGSVACQFFSNRISLSLASFCSTGLLLFTIMHIVCFAFL